MQRERPPSYPYPHPLAVPPSVPPAAAAVAAVAAGMNGTASSPPLAFPSLAGFPLPGGASSPSSSSSSSPGTAYAQPSPYSSASTTTTSSSSSSSPSSSSAASTTATSSSSSSSSSNNPKLLLSAKDLDNLSNRLNFPRSRLESYLQNESSLHNFRVAELKHIINFLRGRTTRPIKVSGNKPALVTRIACEIYQDFNPSVSSYVSHHTAHDDTAAALAQAFSVDYPNKRPRTSGLGVTNYNTKNLIITPGSGTLNFSMSMAYPERQLLSADTFQDEGFDRRQIPYFEEVQRLAVIPFGPKAGIWDRSQTYSRHFDIDPTTVNELERQKKEGKKKGTSSGGNGLAVHVRFYNVDKAEDYTICYDSNLRVNHRPPDLSAAYKKLRLKQYTDPFVTPFPADITSLVTQKNHIEFKNAKGGSGVAVVQLVQELTTADLLGKIETKSVESSSIQEKLPKPTGGNQDVEETKAIVSLRCPLGYCRINNPSKGINCNHLQCFDAECFLQYCNQQRVWQCPVCAKPLPFSELVYDEYFANILNSMDSETMKAEINPDGSFNAPDTTTKKTRAPRSSHEVDVVEICLDEEGKAKAAAAAAAAASSQNGGDSDGDDGGSGDGGESGGNHNNNERQVPFSNFVDIDSQPEDDSTALSSDTEERQDDQRLSPSPPPEEEEEEAEDDNSEEGEDNNSENGEDDEDYFEDESNFLLRQMQQQVTSPPSLDASGGGHSSADAIVIDSDSD